EVVSFGVHFIGFVPVIVCLLLMRVSADSSQLTYESKWQALQAGTGYLSRSRHIASLIIVLCFSSLLVIPYTSLLPAVAKDLFSGDESTFSWFESAACFGAMVGAINMARLKTGENLRYRVLFSAFLMGAAL